MLVWNYILPFVILFITLLFIHFNYKSIDKYDNIDNNMTRKVNINITLWIVFTIIFGFLLYQKGQMNAINGKVEMHQKIIKKYSKKTGELIKQDTIWVYKRFIDKK